MGGCQRELSHLPPDSGDGEISTVGMHSAHDNMTSGKSVEPAKTPPAKGSATKSASNDDDDSEDETEKVRTGSKKKRKKGKIFEGTKEEEDALYYRDRTLKGAQKAFAKALNDKAIIAADFGKLMETLLLFNSVKKIEFHPNVVNSLRVLKNQSSSTTQTKKKI